MKLVYRIMTLISAFLAERSVTL